MALEVGYENGRTRVNYGSTDTEYNASSEMTKTGINGLVRDIQNFIDPRPI